MRTVKTTIEEVGRRHKLGDEINAFTLYNEIVDALKEVGLFDSTGLMMKYFVLSPSKDDEYGEASRKAMRAYAASIASSNALFASDILRWIDGLEGLDEPAALLDSKSEPSLGDYVLATKFDDGNPRDHWCIGFYDGEIRYSADDIRHRIIDVESKSFRANGFRRAEVVSQNVGEWLLTNTAMIEDGERTLWEWRDSRLGREEL